MLTLTVITKDMDRLPRITISYCVLASLAQLLNVFHFVDHLSGDAILIDIRP